MKKSIILHTLLLFFVLIVSSCDEPSNDEPKEEESIVLPGKPVATLPANAETCSDYSEVSDEPDKASILFKWTAAENATGYLLQVFESETEITNKALETTETEVVLVKGKTYSWTVTAINKDGINMGDTSSFTTPGEAVGNYVPYAAEINFDYDSTTMEIDISWVGSDKDGDVLTYDVFVQENGVEIVDYSDFNETSLDTIDAIANGFYWVKIKSKDAAGNFSISSYSKFIQN